MNSGRISRGQPKLLALWAAVLVVLVSLCMPWAMADSRGVIITKDDDFVTVTIPSSLLPEVNTKRVENGQQIKLPGDRAGDKSTKVVVDSALKDKLVRVEQTDQGRTIYINSGKVIWNVVQELPEVTLEGAKEELSKPAPKAASNAAVQKTATPAPALEKAPTVVKTTQAAAAPVPVKETPKPTPVKTEPVKAVEAKPAPAPVKAEPKPTVAVAPTKTEAPKPEIKQSKPPIQVVSVEEVDAPVSKDTTVQPEALANTMDDTATEDYTGIALDEGLTDEGLTQDMTQPETGVPLSEIKHQPVLTMDVVARIVGALVLVLVMLVAFMKFALPNIVEKYPQWVAALKGSTPISLNKMEAPAASAAMPFAAMMPVQKPVSPKEDDRHTPSKAHERISKKDFLEHWGKRQDQFRILTSSKIGRGKELHLVEIKGHHLVVATTPFTVNFITELKDDGPAETLSNEERMATLGDDEQAVVTAYEQALSKEDRHSDTHAYLVDNLREKKLEPQDNIYLQESRPQYRQPEPDPQPAYEPDEEPAFEFALPESAYAPEYEQPEYEPAVSEADQDLYKKYLFPERSEKTVQPRTRTQEAVGSAQSLTNRGWKRAGVSPETFKPATEAKIVQPFNPAVSDYVDAEEVVVLEDYDDEYIS